MACCDPRVMFALSLGLAGALLAAEARAEVRAAAPAPCGPRDQVLAALAGGYGETRRAVGLAENGAAVEILVSDSGSWTIIASLPDGTSCLVASGAAFQMLAPPAAGAPV